VQPIIGVDRDVVRVVEAQRIAPLGADAAAPRLDELPVFREPDETVVAAARSVHVVLVRPTLWTAVAVGDPDVATSRDDDAGRPVEMLLVGTRDTGFAERHHELARGAELVDLMADVLLEACGAARVSVGRAVGHPDVA